MSEASSEDAAPGTTVGEPRQPRRPGWPADRLRFGLALSAVGFRLLAALAMSRTPVGLHDPLLYQRFAQGIAKGQGYVSFNGEPTSYYPPGYPFFLGALQWVCDRLSIPDRLPLVAALAQAVLGGLAVWAIVGVGDRLGRAWFASPDGPHDGRAAAVARAGLIAGALVAVWPNLILHSTVLLSETLFVTLFCWFLLAATVASESTRPGPRLAAGAVLGAAVLVRPQVVLVLAALVVLSLLSQWSWRERVLGVALPILAMVVVVAPWTVRNATVFDRLVPVSTNGGDNLCVGFHEGARGHFAIPASCDTGEFYIDGPEAEARRDAETTDRAVEWVTDHPASLPGLSARKLWYTYEHDHDALRAVESYEQDRFLPSGVRWALRWLSDGYYAVVMVAALVGAAVVGAVAVGRRRDAVVGGRPLAGFVIVATAVSALVPVLFFGETRFKVPATPCFALLAMVAVVAASRRGNPTGERRGNPTGEPEPSATEATP